jgi:hypothetical protein
MRAIDLEQVEARVPCEWQDRAVSKLQRLCELYERLTPDDSDPTWEEDRREPFKKVQEVWQDRRLRQALIDESYGKCWYCEARVEQVADNAIDHYRPKGRVAEDKTHPGYWWLACDLRNYRFACQFCNSARITKSTSGGKQDHFPLWDETRRVRQRGASLIGEQPLLLDPARPDDLTLLGFERDGRPVPRFAKERQPYLYARAAASIRHYHLDRPALNDRRRNIGLAVRDLLLRAEEFAREAETGNNPYAEAGRIDAIRALFKYIQPEAEFSMAARWYVAAERHRSSIADAVLAIPL